MAEQNADTIVILSSELIAKITEEYFNKTLFKQQVTIVDLQPTKDGYMFSVAFHQGVLTTAHAAVKQKVVKGVHERIQDTPMYNSAAVTASTHSVKHTESALTESNNKLQTALDILDGDVLLHSEQTEESQMIEEVLGTLVQSTQRNHTLP